MRIIKVTDSRVRIQEGQKEQKDGSMRPWKMFNQNVRMYDSGSFEDSDSYQIPVPPEVVVNSAGGVPQGYQPGIYVMDFDSHIDRRAFDAPALMRTFSLIPLTNEYYQQYMNRQKAMFEAFLKPKA